MSGMWGTRLHIKGELAFSVITKHKILTLLNKPTRMLSFAANRCEIYS